MWRKINYLLLETPMLQRGCKSMEPSKPFFPRYLPTLVFSLAFLSSESLGYPTDHSRAEGWGGEGRKGCRPSVQAVGQCQTDPWAGNGGKPLLLHPLETSTHSLFVEWTCFSPGFKLGLNVFIPEGGIGGSAMLLGPQSWGAAGTRTQRDIPPRTQQVQAVLRATSPGTASCFRQGWWDMPPSCPEN